MHYGRKLFFITLSRLNYTTMYLFDETTTTVDLSPQGAELAKRLKDKSALIGVVGLGYVGLPIALEYAKKSFNVIGVDVFSSKVDMLNRGENYIEDLADEDIAKIVADGLFSASTDSAVLADADVVFVCVPTPFNENKDPDISYIVDSSAAYAPHMKKGALVILKSTTFPGTTEEYMIPELEKHGMKCGEDFFAAFSPERVDPGNKVFHTGNTPIVVGGVGEEANYLACLANNQIIEKVYSVTNPRIAELEKLLENIFRSVNIALVNELALLCERIEGVNIWEVVEAASTKPFGYMKFTPGPGLGGHCIPIDPYYLSWLARAHDFETRFITLAANVNESMPYHVVNKVIKVISKEPIALKNASVLILGAAFKKNVKDLRHAPTEKIVQLLWSNEVSKVDISDPWVPVYKVDDHTFHSVELTPERIASYDCVILAVDHDAYDVESVLKHAKVVIDTKNMAEPFPQYKDKVELLGSSL